MFESLSGKLSGIFGSLRSKGKISASDIDSTTQELRTALLDADVALTVVESSIVS